MIVGTAGGVQQTGPGKGGSSCRSYRHPSGREQPGLVTLAAADFVDTGPDLTRSQLNPLAHAGRRQFMSGWLWATVTGWAIVTGWATVTG